MSLAQEIQTSNWRFLIRRLTSSKPHRAVATKINSASRSELHRLLRLDHEEDVSDPPEVAFRVLMDEWLDAVGILYLGWLCGYVPDPSKMPERGLMLAILGNEAVREYYESYYPASIPWLLRLHLQHAAELPSTESIEAAGAFERFAIIHARFSSDPMLLQFLRFLNGAWYGDTSARIDIQTVIDCFGIPERMGLAFGRTTDQLSQLDRGIVGMIRFLSHSRGLDGLLSRCTGLPLCQSGLWFFYSRWFRGFELDAATVLSSALGNALMAVRAASSAGMTDRISMVLADVENCKGIMARLTSGKYAAELLRAVSFLRGQSGEVDDSDDGGIQGWLSGPATLY